MPFNNDDPNRVGLWEKKTKDGKPYFSGQWNGHWVDLFPNSYKQGGDNKPAFHLKLKPKDAPSQDRYAGQGAAVHPQGPWTPSQTSQAPGLRCSGPPVTQDPHPPMEAPQESFMDENDVPF